MRGIHFSCVGFSKASFLFVIKAHVYNGAPAGFPCNLSLSAFRVLRWELNIWIWNLKVLELQEPVSSPSKPRTTGHVNFFFNQNWKWSQIWTAEWNSALIEPFFCFFFEVRTLFKEIKIKRRELKSYKTNDKDLKSRQQYFVLNKVWTFFHGESPLF